MTASRIYCSGPLFCAEEVGGMSAIAQQLEQAGFQTFLPHRDGLEPYVMRLGNTPLPGALSGIRTRIDHAIFALDVYELIERCDAVVCNLNGRVPDEGMIVEAALAYAAGKPLVLFKDDVRAPFGGFDNAMLTSLVKGRIVGALTEIPAAVRAELAGKKTAVVNLSADLVEAIRQGRQIARALEALPRRLGKQRWDEAVVRQVIEAGLG
ncbi:MAG: nucleoside 2-deoxyribosyltransferase [Fluviicoccus sp.]|uniref:nucleoside 2-deoxyribosyltransferase n=1 Tax=Fluviicoccus sp. TaxID=2003552 RepID=UPI0027164549|nr:nucleoside 2-deoxyribosyltransferase [Fluviicoccus sp.]MDO8330571.1 nucleoside 2-deoxyribosyltransferase [Fluviicoccus sp.]